MNAISNSISHIAQVKAPTDLETNIPSAVEVRAEAEATLAGEPTTWAEAKARLLEEAEDRAAAEKALALIPDPPMPPATMTAATALNHMIACDAWITAEVHSDPLGDDAIDYAVDVVLRPAEAALDDAPCITPEDVLAKVRGLVFYAKARMGDLVGQERTLTDIEAALTAPSSPPRAQITPGNPGEIERLVRIAEDLLVPARRARDVERTVQCKMESDFRRYLDFQDVQEAISRVPVPPVLEGRDARDYRRLRKSFGQDAAAADEAVTIAKAYSKACSRARKEALSARSEDYHRAMRDWMACAEEVVAASTAYGDAAASVIDYPTREPAALIRKAHFVASLAGQFDHWAVFLHSGRPDLSDPKQAMAYLCRSLIGQLAEPTAPDTELVALGQAERMLLAAE